MAGSEAGKPAHVRQTLGTRLNAICRLCALPCLCSLAGWAAQAAEFAKEQEMIFQQMNDANTGGAWDMLTDEQLSSVFQFAMDDGE
jgi:hypothetical protein